MIASGYEMFRAPTRQAARPRPWVILAWALTLVWAGADRAAGIDELTGESEYVVVKAGRVITVAGEVFEPGTIVIEDGKITGIGKDLEYPSSAKVIRAGRQTVMPGLVLARSRYGLMSYARTGVHGDRSAAEEVYPTDIDWRDLLEAGFTTVAVVPDGRGVPGMAGVYHTAGPQHDRLIKDGAFLHVAPNWSAGGKKVLRDALRKAQEEIEKVEKARKEWEEKQKAAKKKEEQQEQETPGEKGKEKNGDKKEPSRRASDGNGNGDEEKENKPNGNGAADKKAEPEEFKPPKIDPKYQPLVDLIQKKEGASMMVEVDSASDLLHLDDVLEPFDEPAHFLFFVPRPEVPGFRRARFGQRGEFLRSDFHHIVERLGKRQARIVLAPTIQYLPDTTFRYNLMAELASAGCEVSVVPRIDSRTELQRLRLRLAEVTRAGLKREKALASLSLAPARAIGLGDRLGSLEKGKDADIVFFDGDPLDPHSRIRRVMILGETVWEAE